MDSRLACRILLVAFGILSVCIVGSNAAGNVTEMMTTSDSDTIHNSIPFITTTVICVISLARLLY